PNNLLAPLDRHLARNARSGIRPVDRTRNCVLRKHSLSKRARQQAALLPRHAWRIAMPLATAERPLSERAQEVLRRAGNPFRNYFARNPDDDVCSRYHVPELFAVERAELLGVVDLYRYDHTTHSA